MQVIRETKTVKIFDGLTVSISKEESKKIETEIAQLKSLFEAQSSVLTFYDAFPHLAQIYSQLE